MLRHVALVRTDLVFLRSVRRLLVTASIVPSLPILVTLMKEALSSSETSVLIRATRQHPRRHHSLCTNCFVKSIFFPSTNYAQKISNIGWKSSQDFSQRVELASPSLTLGSKMHTPEQKGASMTRCYSSGVSAIFPRLVAAQLFIVSRTKK
jgi:hypothetical protein